MKKPLRLLQMDLDEVAFRSRLALYKRLDRLQSSARTAFPDHTSDRGPARIEMARFFAGVADRRSRLLLGEHFPDERRSILRRAEPLCRSRFDLLGYHDLFFGEPVDWHVDPLSGKRSRLEHWSRLDPLDGERCGDIKVVWELNRHQGLVRLAQAYHASGDERYAEAAVALLRGWMWANPPGLGVNWASSLEVSLRLVSWCWTLGLIQSASAAAAALRETVPQWLALHAAHVRRYTSLYSSPNTHLTGEALGLFYAGVLLGELDASREWRELGANTLIEEIEKQVIDDGVYFEQSTCYQRYTVDIYLHFLILAARNGVEVPPRVGERVQSLLDFLLAVRAPNGRLPRIGDGDGGSLLPLVAREASDARGTFAVAAAWFARPDYAWAAGGATPEVLWLLGPAGLSAFDALEPAPPDRPASRAFGEGGYAVMQSGWDRQAHQLIFDVGPLGCPLSSGHGHADLLSVQCATYGEPCLADPGTYCYAVDPRWRNALRSTAAHSTVRIDGADQADPEGPFSWRDRPRATLRRWRSEAAFDYAEGEHRAYERLPQPVCHRRRVVFVKPRYWIVVDDLAGAGEHRVELRFQFDPLEIERRGGPWIAAHGAAGAGLLVGAFAPDCALEPDVVRGDAERLEGWAAPDYGIRLPAPSVVYRVAAALPLRLLAVLLPCRRAETTVRSLPRIAPLPGAPPGFRLEYGSDVVIVGDDSIRLHGEQGSHELG